MSAVVTVVCRPLNVWCMQVSYFLMRSIRLAPYLAFISYEMLAVKVFSR